MLAPNIKPALDLVFAGKKLDPFFVYGTSGLIVTTTSLLLFFYQNMHQHISEYNRSNELIILILTQKMLQFNKC